MGQLTGGVFLTGYALALHANAMLIGLLAALPLIVKLSQLYTSWYIERAGEWRRSALRSAFLSRFTLLLAAAIPFLFPDTIVEAWALATIIFISSVAGSLFDLAYLTWMAELIPESVRGEFLGKRSRLSGIIGQALALIAAFGLDNVRRRLGSDTGFALLFGIGALVGLVGLIVLRYVPAPRRAQSRVARPSIVSALTQPARDPNYRRMLEFVGLWHFAIGLVGPFITVFMLRELRLSFLLVTALSVITNLVTSLTMTYWGQLGDHFGSKTALRAGLYLVTFTTLIWFTINPHNIWPIFVIQFTSGFGWAAYHANLNNLALKLSLPDKRPSSMAALGAVQGTFEAVAPIVGGVLLSLVRALGVSEFFSFYVLFAISFVLRALATPLPARVFEPGGVPVGRMIRVMQRFRTMNVEQPLEPFFNLAYTHLARIADFIARERNDDGPGPRHRHAT